MKRSYILLVLLLVGMLLVSSFSDALAQEGVPQGTLPNVTTDGLGLGTSDKLRVYPEDLSEFGMPIALIIDEPPAMSGDSKLPMSNSVRALGSVFVLTPTMPQASDLLVFAVEYVTTQPEGLSFVQHDIEYGRLPSLARFDLDTRAPLPMEYNPSSEASAVGSQLPLKVRQQETQFRSYTSSTEDSMLVYWLLAQDKNRLLEVSIHGTPEMEDLMQQIIIVLRTKIERAELKGVTYFRSQMVEPMDNVGIDARLSSSISPSGGWINQVSAGWWRFSYSPNDGEHVLAVWPNAWGCNSQTFDWGTCNAWSPRWGCISQWRWWSQTAECTLGVPDSTWLNQSYYGSYTTAQRWDIANYRANIYR